MIFSRLRLHGSVVLLAFMILTSAAPVAQAAQGVSFSLSDAEVQKGRLFEVSLIADGDCDVAAFVAKLNFDAGAVEYKGVSDAPEGAQYSVNSAESGKLTVAYLCESGISCAENTKLITFEFKALTAIDSQISLAVKDLINRDGEDMAVVSCEGADVSVVSAGKSKEGSNNKALNDSTEELETDGKKGEISEYGSGDSKRIFGASVDTAVIVAISLAALALVCAVAYLAYKLGVRNQREKEKPEIPLEKDSSGKNEILSKNGKER